MHGDEQKWVNDAFEKNWITTAGENVNEVEKLVAEYAGVKYAVALSCGTASLHLATKLAGEKLYGQPKPNQGTLQGHKVFCADMTFDATVNPVAYEDGEAVFLLIPSPIHGICVPRLLKRLLRSILMSSLL